MYKFVLAISLIFGLANITNAQIKIDGPKDSPVGELIQLYVTELKAKDLKVTVLKDGLPAIKGFSVLKDFNDQVVISFFTKEQGIYSIMLSGNLDNKTYTALHVLTLTSLIPDPKPKPIVPDPKPIPIPDPKPPEPVTWADQLKLEYGKAPDPNAKQSLLIIFGDMRSVVTADAITNYGHFETNLASMAQNKLGPNALRPCRDLISKYILSKTGDDPRRWNKQLMLTTIDEVTNALKDMASGLPNNKDMK